MSVPSDDSNRRQPFAASSDPSGKGTPARTAARWETITDLWTAWASQGSVSAADALDAATAIAYETFDQIDQQGHEPARLRSLLGDEAFEKLQDRSAAQLKTALMMGARIGYAVAKTVPKERHQLSSWPFRALMYAGLDETVGDDPTMRIVDARQTLKNILLRLMNRDQKSDRPRDRVGRGPVYATQRRVSKTFNWD